MPAAFYILFGAAFTSLVCLAAGRILLRGAGATLRRGEEDSLAFVAGAAVMSLLIFVLAAVHLARKGVFLAVGVIILAAAVRFGAHRNTGPAFPPLPRLWKWLFIAIFAAFTVLYFFNAMAPEISPDGASYHLGVVSRYAREHGLRPFPMNLYGRFSQGIEMLFLMAYTFGRNSSAALVHFAFLLSLAFSILSYGRRNGLPVAGAGAALLVYASPLFGIDGTAAYVDVAVAAILFAVFYLLQVWERERSARLLALIGAVAGFAYAAKYSAVFAVVYAAGYVLWRTRRIKPAAVVVLFSLALILPWAGRNALWYCNPFSPMLNAWFDNPYMHVSRDIEWTSWLRSYDLPNRWTIPLEVTYRGGLAGVFGPVFLLLPFALLSLRRAQGRRLLFAGALFSLPYAANIGARFLIPALPFFAFGLAMVFAARPSLLVGAVVLHAVLSWPPLMRYYASPYVWRLPDGIPFKAALRIEPEDTYLSRHGEYLIARMIEKEVRPGGHVFSTLGIPEAYTAREIWVNWQSGANEVLNDIFYAAIGRDNQPRFAVEFRFPPIAVRKLRAVQTAKASGDQQWGVFEFRLFSGSVELCRNSRWRLRARPNPWDVQLAFDHSPVTRWRSWAPFRPGMFVEVELGAAQMVDRVLLDCASECTLTKVRLDGADASGAWRTLSDSPSIAETGPVRFMGREAIGEMKARGVDYLLIRDSDWGAAEILEDPKAWGLTPVGRAFDARLYRLDASPPLEPDCSNPKELHGPLLTRR
jgi:4-amino-4-deoxy-L-arabinose transferase-like glycosyltransferase